MSCPEEAAISMLMSVAGIVVEAESLSGGVPVVFSQV
jgi:hypothetical protein